MEYETIRVDIEGDGVARLTLNRPDKHNSISGQMMSDLTAATASLASDDAVRVVILAAEGNSFCAGGDLGWMKQQFHASREERTGQARILAHLLRDLNTIPKPLIARVQGQAFGGGDRKSVV